MRKLERNDLRLVLGGATASAYCMNHNTGHEYLISCSGGTSCTSSDYNGCSCTGGSGANDVKLCPTENA